MLFYCSMHPNWDYFGAFPKTEKCRVISQLLETVATTHYRNTGACFAALERQGIFLGNGAFKTILVQKNPFGQFDPLDTVWTHAVADAAAACLDVPVWYGISMGGKLYILCCFPRLTEGSPGGLDAEHSVLNACQTMQTILQPDGCPLRIIASDIQYEESGIFRTFNGLAHALDYYDFRTEQRSPIHLNSEDQLHGALIGDLSVYRQLSVVIAQQLSRSPFFPEAVANQVCDALIENSVPSMESIHHHVQIFMLTFTEYLGSSGLVDAAYMSRHKIVYRSMAFERERELRSNMATILEELHRQNRTLRTIGRQKRIQAIREYVEAHITDPELTAAQISDLFQIGAAQVAKQFRYYYGVSLHRFIGQARFQRTEDLLRQHPDWSMRKIAGAAGYTDLSTMYRAFHALGDITPGALRDSLRQNAPEVKPAEGENCSRPSGKQYRN